MVKVDGRETDPWRTRFKYTLVKAKVCYERGDSWLSKFRNLMSLIFYFVAFQAVLEKYTPIRVDLMIFAVVVPIGYVIGNMIIGYIDFTYGIMKDEAVFGSKDVNPFFDKIDRRIKEIDRKIDLLRYQQRRGQRGRRY